MKETCIRDLQKRTMYVKTWAQPRQVAKGTYVCGKRPIQKICERDLYKRPTERTRNVNTWAQPHGAPRSCAQVLHFMCVAVCCSVLQCVAVCCSVLQHIVVCCGVLQRVAVCGQLGMNSLRRVSTQDQDLYAWKENYIREKRPIYMQRDIYLWTVSVVRWHKTETCKHEKRPINVKRDL